MRIQLGTWANITMASEKSAIANPVFIMSIGVQDETTTVMMVDQNLKHQIWCYLDDDHKGYIDGTEEVTQFTPLGKIQLTPQNQSVINKAKKIRETFLPNGRLDMYNTFFK